MTSHTSILSAVCLTALIGLGASMPTTTHAQEVGNLAYYDITDAEYRNHYIHWKNYLENQSREPCQSYLAPPPGFYVRNCDLYRIEQPRSVSTRTETTTLLPIVSSYTVHFDFDKSGVRASEQETIDRLANDLSRYNPTQVTIAGHTDTSGDADYNRDLSQKRATAVAQALTARGIESQIIDKEAYGETDLAVETGNGVKSEENRRVVIDFRR